MPKKIARLLGLVAYVAAVGVVALFVLVAYVSRRTPTGGMDATTAWVTWLSLGGMMLALVITGHVLGKQLLLIAREGDAPQP
ncbi:MAG: hypothetical protein ACRENQ_13825, partial [Gemmatimonadaceae bacterium]